MLFLCWNRGLPQKFPGLMSGTAGLDADELD